MNEIIEKRITDILTGILFGVGFSLLVVGLFCYDCTEIAETRIALGIIGIFAGILCATRPINEEDLNVGGGGNRNG